MTSADDRAATFLQAITYLRIALTPVVMALIWVGDRVSWATPAAATLFAIAAITDYFDGRLARRWKQTTTLGNFLDTTADKLLVSGVLVSLVAVGRCSMWVAFIIIGRELLVMGLRGAVTAGDGTVIRPSIWGKLKANVQFLAIFLAIWRPDVMIGDWYLDQVVMAIAAVITVASAVEYFARLRRCPGRQRPTRAKCPRALTRVGDVFVTGGSGFVGGALVQRLVAEGRFVKALARSEAAAEIVRALGAQPVRGRSRRSGRPARGHARGAHRLPRGRHQRDVPARPRAHAARERRGLGGRGAGGVGRQGRAGRPHLLGRHDRRGHRRHRPRGHAAPRQLPVAVRALEAARRAQGPRVGDPSSVCRWSA